MELLFMRFEHRTAAYRQVSGRPPHYIKAAHQICACGAPLVQQSRCVKATGGPKRDDDAAPLLIWRVGPNLDRRQ